MQSYTGMVLKSLPTLGKLPLSNRSKTHGVMKNLCSLVALFTLFSFSSLQAQCTKGNCKTGKGTYLYPSGAKYVGDFKNGKIHGEGMLIFSNGNRYVGQWENQFRQGKGKMTFANGDIYRGNFNQSKFHGNGTMEFKKGDKYEGQWGNDLQNGKGTYYYKSGNKYEGQFKNGKLHGQGTMTYKDGNKYAGHWENNYKDGQGVFYKADGSQIAGLWQNGKYVEEGSEMDEIAATEKVNAVDTTIPTDELPDCTRGDCPDGIGVYAYGDGSKWVGEFVNGVPDGEGTCYYANSDKYVGSWKRHAPHGEGIMYYANQRVVGAIWEYGNPIQELEASNDMIAKEKVKVVRDDDVKIWAVVVGVARYVHMPVLKYTDDDAYHIYAFLKSPEGGALPDEQIRVLIDDDANRANIIRTMRQVFLQADENDVVILYYSGHGLPGSFLPVDFDGFNNKLQHQDIKDVFGETKAKHKLVLADACHSGSLLSMRAASSNAAVHTTLKKYYDAFENSKGGTALLLSSKGDEYSLEDKGLRQGIFSHYLIRGLKGEADKNKNKIVTVTELFDFVHSKVRVYTGNAQTPTMTGEFDPNMPVAVSRR